MSTTPLKRVFDYNGMTLEDPNPAANMTPEEVVQFYANIYPELTNATIEQTEIKEGVATYSIRRAAGTKG